MKRNYFYEQVTNAIANLQGVYEGILGGTDVYGVKSILEKWNVPETLTSDQVVGTFKSLGFTIIPSAEETADYIIMINSMEIAVLTFNFVQHTIKLTHTPDIFSFGSDLILPETGTVN